MPELPEVEAVRRGLARYLPGRSVERVEVLDARPLRRQEGGAEAFIRQLEGRTITAAVRRGKFLWFPLDDGRALAAHLGMSGQLLVRGPALTPQRPEAEGEQLEDTPPSDQSAERGHTTVVLADPEERRVDLTARQLPTLVRDLSTQPRHMRVRLHLSSLMAGDSDTVTLDYIDQRMFGGLHVAELVSTTDGKPAGVGSAVPLLPAHATGIARDLLDPAVDRRAVVADMRRSRRAIKTLLLDQHCVSGIGNIYADEGLWAARIHGACPGQQMSVRALNRLLACTAEVMERALEAGGTSFDALYVNAEGAPGFFARHLHAYGRAELPCHRCGASLRSGVIAARSHTFCPRCQRRRPGR